MAFTFCASFSRWAIRWRMRDIFTYKIQVHIQLTRQLTLWV